MISQKTVLPFLAAGALIAVPAAASAETTITATAVTKSTANTGKNTFVQVEVLKSGGKSIGGDVVNGTYHSDTKEIDLDVSAALSGGTVYIEFRGIGQQKSFSGKIAGGSGKYKGATGTVDATGNGNKKTKVVLHIN